MVPRLSLRWRTFIDRGRGDVRLTCGTAYSPPSLSDRPSDTDWSGLWGSNPSSQLGRLLPLPEEIRKTFSRYPIFRSPRHHGKQCVNEPRRMHLPLSRSIALQLAPEGGL